MCDAGDASPLWADYATRASPTSHSLPRVPHGVPPVARLHPRCKAIATGSFRAARLQPRCKAVATGSSLFRVARLHLLRHYKANEAVLYLCRFCNAAANQDRITSGNMRQEAATPPSSDAAWHTEADTPPKQRQLPRLNRGSYPAFPDRVWCSAEYGQIYAPCTGGIYQGSKGTLCRLEQGVPVQVEAECSIE